MFLALVVRGLQRAKAVAEEAGMTVEGIGPFSIAALGAAGLVMGWVAWRVSIWLLGLWGVPDALLARRLVRKGEHPMRLEIREPQEASEHSPLFRWRPEHNPVMSPSVAYLHHLAVAVILAGLAAGTLTLSGLVSHMWYVFLLLFGLSFLVLLPLAWRGLSAIKRAQARYDESASRTFARLYPLDAFNTPEMIDQLRALKAAAEHVPGGFRHIHANFLDYVAKEAGKLIFIVENRNHIQPKLFDILVQAEIDLQTISFLDACFADAYPALAPETRQFEARRSLGFAAYAAAFEAQDAGRLVTAIFQEPGVTYIRKAKDAMEKMFREVQQLRLFDDISSSRLAAEAARVNPAT